MKSNYINHTNNKKCFEAGITPIILLVALAASSMAVFGSGLYVNKLIKNGNLSLFSSPTEQLLMSEANYLDKNKVNKSTVQGNVIGTVMLPDGSFSAYRVLDGQISNEGESFGDGTRVVFFSGDIGYGDYSDNTISPFYLKDGTKTTAVIVDRMIVELNDGDTATHPIKILNGTVVKGKITGDFLAQTLDTGYYISGTIGDSGKVSNSYVVLGAPKLSEAQTIVDTKALSAYKQISFVFDGVNHQVLGESTDTLGNAGSNEFNKPVYNDSTGTWVFAGGVSGGNVSASPIQGVINYVQNIAQSISNGTALQPVSEMVEGIREIRSNNSKLSVSTLNNVATLSLDLSNITSSVADGAISTAKVADGAITSDKISDGTITSSDLSSSLLASMGSGGDITAVIAGNGLTGGATSGDATLSINLPTSGSSSATSSNSGLESGLTGLSLLKGV